MESSNQSGNINTSDSDVDSDYKQDVLSEKQSHSRGWRNLILKLVLIAVGFMLALILAELVLRANPKLIPQLVRAYPPVLRIEQMVDRTYDFKFSDGDLFQWLAGDLAPIPEHEDLILDSVTYVTDENGFRNPPPVQEQYDILTFGDSITEGRFVATPWPVALSIYTEMTVYNLGFSALGPQGEVNLLKRFGPKLQPQWIILAYFEGNDLHDAAEWERSQPFLVPRLVKYYFSSIVNRNSNDVNEEPQVKVKPSDYRYPISIRTGENVVSMAFLPGYVSWLTANSEDIQMSRNLELVQESLAEAQQINEKIGGCLVLVYVPSKPHIYLPYIDEAEKLQRIFKDVTNMKLADSGYLEFSGEPAEPNHIQETMNAQAKVLQELANDTQIPFIDLTEYFQAGTENGEQLYYSFDTHWNQEGHNLAAQTIADYLKDMDWANCILGTSGG